jgi:hypothetical protein
MKGQSKAVTSDLIFDSRTAGPLTEFFSQRKEVANWGTMIKIGTFFTRLGIERDEKKQKLERRVL